MHKCALHVRGSATSMENTALEHQMIPRSPSEALCQALCSMSPLKICLIFQDRHELFHIRNGLNMTTIPVILLNLL
jgi:hypothetical protein